jgi:acyl-CoA reductase-like NAD-dependent aldehyde dehydrogenase
MSVSEIISVEPATGAVFWRAPISDVNAEVEIARESWVSWAAQSLSVRVEALRRFANVVRSKSDTLVDAVARETGKPMWDARNEIEAVINRVEISVGAYILNERHNVASRGRSERAVRCATSHMVCSRFSVRTRCRSIFPLRT